MLKKILVACAISAAALVLAGCGGGTFRTYYEAHVTAEQSRSWRVTDVIVSVPASLKVSEERTYVPRADIVWREDPLGDRRAQVGAIVKNAALRAASELKGSRPVRLEISVSRFHAMTFEAEALNIGAGVHNIDFTVRAVDVRTGKVLAGPEAIEASFPAVSGTEMIEARLRGESQKLQIMAQLINVVAGWLGIGPDPRRTFVRAGS